MALSIPLVWADGHRLHEPSAEIWVGVGTPAAELPRRADAIRATMLEAGADEVPATPHDDSALEAVHDSSLLAFLASAWADWEVAGLPADPGQGEVVPYIFPHPGLMGGLEPQLPAATWARPGAFCFDTMTLDRPRYLGGGARSGGRGAHGGGSRRRWGATRLCLLPAPRASRDAERLRRVVLPQQRRHRGAATACRGSGEGRDHRHRRSSRERRPVDLLGAE